MAAAIVSGGHGGAVALITFKMGPSAAASLVTVVVVMAAAEASPPSVTATPTR